MRIIVLANWGIGFEILKTLSNLPEIETALVVTQHAMDTDDTWYNKVYDYALQMNYPVVTQDTFSFDRLKEFIVTQKIDLIIVHAFMKILPKEIYTAPRYGCINFHPSLLPMYRGQSPTYWVLKNKEPVTGLTCHYVDEGIDTGDIIFQVEVMVEPYDTIESVIEKQKQVLEKLLVESLSRVVDPDFIPAKQLSCFASYAPKPKRTIISEEI